MSDAFPSDEGQPISFPTWKSELESVAEGQRGLVRMHVLDLLRYAKGRHAPVTVALVKQYLAEGRGGRDEARPALRWFCSGGRVRPASAVEQAERDKPVAAAAERVAVTECAGRDGGGAKTSRRPVLQLRSGVPPLAAGDLGGADWERDLITAIRSRGLLWRTEETYRGWARRFAKSLAPRSPYAAETADVGRFLTELAVTQRASRSTQRQALNALVFLMQEALHRQLGEIPFRRAEKGGKVPTVLSKEECRRLFAELRDTTRLMAELAYGAGLRLLELLRLRVHHLDLARRQLQIYDGKGAKHRLTVLPEAVVPTLTAHVERLRRLHAEDRAAGLPGVWLPEGLEAKYRRAGEQWEWQWVNLWPRRPRGARLDHPCASLRGQPLTQTAG